MPCPEKPVIVIAGPTASGKSALALDCAIALGGVVVNADASQLYADIPVLSAAPSLEERGRTPHRLYGVRDGGEPASAVWWAEQAKAEIAAAWEAGRLPVLVGGTGLYLRTLLEGIAPVPEIDPAVRQAVRALSPEQARAALAVEDPEAGVTDPQRVARALEVVRGTGRRLRAWQAERVGGLQADVRGFVLEVAPDALAERIARRFDLMLDAGARDEVRRLLARGLDPALPVMKALGVRPLLAELAGELTPEAARDAAIAEIRRYAKRQRTWFRNQHGGWVRIGLDMPVSNIVAGLAR